MTKKNVALIVLPLLVFLGGLHSGQAAVPSIASRDADQFLEISAEIKIVSFPASDSSAEAHAEPKIISLVCITGTNEWRIENDFLQGAENKYFFDGTNVYASVRPTKPLSEELADKLATTSGLAVVPYERARSNLTIRIWDSRGGHPLGDLAVNIPWLAFCSGPYLMRNGRIIPLPVAELRHTRDRFAYTDKTETFPDALGLPRTVELFTSRSLYRSSQDDFDNESSFGDRYAAWKKKSVASLEEGVRTFQYSVLESTNVFGRTFPIKFEFFQKGRAYEQNGNWFCRGIGSVKSIRPSARPEGLFVPSLQQTIVDYRFRDPTGKVRSIVYTSTNASASPIDDPELQRKFRASVERMQRPKTGAK